MFNENKTFFIKKLDTKALRYKGTELKRIWPFEAEKTVLYIKRKMAFL